MSCENYDITQWYMRHNGLCPNCGVNMRELPAEANLTPHWAGECKPIETIHDRVIRAEYSAAHWKAEAERLRSLLEAAGTRIWEHHEIGHIRRAAETLTGHCEACKDDLFAKIEAALRRTGGPQK